MNAYLINLADASERLAHSVNSLTQNGFDVIRIEAVNGKELELDRSVFNELMYKLKHGKKTSKSEIGCYLSHMKAMQEFLLSNESHAVIVEDDVDILKNTNEIIEEALEHKAIWDILRLSGLHSGTPMRCIPLQFNKYMCINLTRLMGAGAYMINRRAAEVFLKKLMPMSLPYDHAFDREWFYGLKAMSINPPTILQDNLPFKSQINDVQKNKYPSYIRYWTVFPFRFYTELLRLLFRIFQFLKFKIIKNLTKPSN